VKIVREIAPWCVLAAWLGCRQAIFGSFGTSIGGAGYFDHFDLWTATDNLLQSLGQLVAPANVSALAAAGLPVGAIRAAFLVPSAALLVTWLGLSPA
jgi:hypothetical protein